MNKPQDTASGKDRAKPRQMKRRVYRIDSAPAKDLIALFSDGARVAQLTPAEREQALQSLLNQRSQWACGYPFIHDFVVTYGAFDDFRGVPSEETRLTLLPSALSIALKAPDRLFHMALSLLLDLIPTSGSFVRPPGLSDALPRLRLRAERLSFLPNLECTWSSLMGAQRHLRSEGEGLCESDHLHRYTPEQLKISSEAWKRFFPFPFINHKARLLKELPAVQRPLRDITQKINPDPGARRLLMSTRVEQTLYWVWHVPVERGQWSLYRQFHERWDDAAISRRLLNIEFSDTALEPLQ